jgi:hypothetical protein
MVAPMLLPGITLTIQPTSSFLPRLTGEVPPKGAEGEGLKWDP